MTFVEWARWVELVSVGTVVITTIILLQHHLTKAHILLRFGLLMVCIGSLIELYQSLQVETVACMAANDAALLSIVENIGQATVYLWAVRSKRLSRVLRLLNRK